MLILLVLIIWWMWKGDLVQAYEDNHQSLWWAFLAIILYISFLTFHNIFFALLEGYSDFWSFINFNINSINSFKNYSPSVISDYNISMMAYFTVFMCIDYTFMFCSIWTFNYNKLHSGIMSSSNTGDFKETIF